MVILRDKLITVSAKRLYAENDYEIESLSKNRHGRFAVSKSFSGRLDFLLAAALVLLSTPLMSQCGGNSPRVDEQERNIDSAFRTIQIHEAELEAHREMLWTGDLVCERSCDAAESLCLQSRDICTIARRIKDGDALTRCRRATDTCYQETRRVSVRCRCRKQVTYRSHDELD
ncbi:MAG: hypothetical protein JXA30_06560 [Deltaproteobacteria bacterium]|nr:hypothetical protein [Deltaproteobacteria bacterium]